MIRDGRDEAMTAASCRGVSKRFGSALAVRSATLELREGELLALLGRSGCGKTTLLRLIAGLERADEGRIEIAGRLVEGSGTHVPPEKRGVGVVFQDYALFPHLTVEKNVAFGLPRRERRGGAVREMLELVGLADKGKRRPHELSGGERQRVALARALAPRPAVVLLDEPFAALDTSLRASVRTQVREALCAVGATAVLVTHDQEEALSVADEVAILADGRVVQHGHPMSVYARPSSAQVAQFLGDAMVLAASSDGTHASSALGSVRASGATPGRGHVVLRPEQLVVLPRGAGGVPGDVVSTEFFGHDALVTVSLAGQHTVVRSRMLGAPHHLVAGTPVSVFVKGEGTYFADPARDRASPAMMRE